MDSCDQKQSFSEKTSEIEDLSRERSATMPLSTKETVSVVKRRTIFDPIYPNDVISPEENTNDYLELNIISEYFPLCDFVLFISKFAKQLTLTFKNDL